MKKRKITKMIVLLLAMVMMFSIPIEASAAAKVTAVTSPKKAKKVKTGKTVVTIPKSKNLTSYVKFTATKTKTYKITFNNLREYGKKSSQCIDSMWATLETMGKSGDIERTTFKQNGKKTNVIFICSQESWVYGKTKKIVYDTFIPSRTVIIRLKKGQTIYIQSGTDSLTKRCYDLTIK